MWKDYGNFHKNIVIKKEDIPFEIEIIRIKIMNKKSQNIFFLFNFSNNFHSLNEINIPINTFRLGNTFKKNIKTEISFEMRSKSTEIKN